MALSKFPIYQSGNSFYSNKSDALNLSSSSSIGEIKEGKVIYSIYEVLYLLEQKKVELIKGKNKINFSELIKRANSSAYVVFKDLRDKGNIVKEGMKYGSDFRIYKPGTKPGKGHAAYLVSVIEKTINLKDISAKSRVAHSTNKKLILALIDKEQDITYLQVEWKSIL